MATVPSIRKLNLLDFGTNETFNIMYLMHTSNNLLTSYLFIWFWSNLLKFMFEASNLNYVYDNYNNNKCSQNS